MIINVSWAWFVYLRKTLWPGVTDSSDLGPKCQFSGYENFTSISIFHQINGDSELGL